MPSLRISRVIRTKLMTYLSLFSGAGGFEWFAKLLGWRCVGYVESDEYCRNVLIARIRDCIFDDAPIFPDVRTFCGLPYRGRVDCITAGPPCQPDSHAGHQRGDADERDGWPDTLRIIAEVRPRRVFLETVTGFFRGKRIWDATAFLASIGYDCRWMPLSAFECGAEHERIRGWIMADSMRKRFLYLPTQSAQHTTNGDQGFRPNEETRNTAWRSDYVSLQCLAYTGDIREVDGLAGWCNRLSAAGNGIVPAVAREAWLRLTNAR